jgi:hypothetical protein
MNIQSIKLISKNEAIVIVSLPKSTFNIFVHPFSDNLEIKPYFYSINVRNIEKTNSLDDSVFMLDGEFQCKIFGKVENLKNNIIRVENILIELDNPLPKDIKIGDRVEFICDRLDF